MLSQGVVLNECSDMDMRSASSSSKSSSPSVDKGSCNSSIEKGDDEKPLDYPMSVEAGLDDDDAVAVIEAPSDEEGEVKRKKKDLQQQEQSWELKDGMVQVKVPRGGRSSVTEENQNDSEEHTDKHPTFENARLKWDNATAQLTKRRVDRLGTQSWHGKRRLQDMAPVKTRSAPRNSLRSNETITSSPIQEPSSTEKSESASSGPAEPGKDEIKSLSPPCQANGNVEQPKGKVSKETEGDEQSISVPTPATARSKFAAMSESANLESSTTSFLAELPKMPRRWKIDDDGSVASSVVRGGRVYKIQGPSTTKRYPYSSGPSKWTPRQTLPSSNSIASRTLTTGTSSESSDDDDITEYNTVVPLNDGGKRGSVERSESGSSFTPSIATYDDFDGNYPLETVQSAGSKSDPQDSRENTASVESGQEQSEYAPLNDTESYRKANRQEDDDEDDEEEEELGDYEEDLQDAKPLADFNHFVVDKVPAKKRWSSKNIHNFPVWPPIIKVQTWDRRNVSAVSIGSGFSFDESLTNSNAVVSSLGDDDISYEEEEFIRRPPEHRTSYRIRYDGPTSLNLDDIYKSPIADSDCRFESTKKRADGLPTMPARRVTDSAPSAPPRISTLSDSDDASVSLSVALEDEGNKRPDVWITPVSGSLPTEPIWKVRRVWAVEDEDEKEQDHAVGNHELFDKIKSLVGARDGPSGNVLDNAPQLPQRSWHVRTIVEKRGRLENVEAEKSLDVEELQENIKVMAEEAVKEIASNQKVFEEYKVKRELKKAEEELMQDLPSVESEDEFDNNTFATTEATTVVVDDVGEVTCVRVDDGGEVGRGKAADVDQSASLNANEADETAAVPRIDEVGDSVDDKTASDKACSIDEGETITDSADVQEAASRSAEEVIQPTITTKEVDLEMPPNTINDTNDTMDASQEETTEVKSLTIDNDDPTTDVRVENDDETVMDTESVVLPTTSDVSEKKTTKKKKKREISPKSSPKASKDAVGDESADVPSTPVTTKLKRRSSTTSSAMALPSPPAVTPKTPKKSKSKTKSGDVSALVSPKRVSKSSKELSTATNDSPVPPKRISKSSRELLAANNDSPVPPKRISKSSRELLAANNDSPVPPKRTSKSSRELLTASNDSPVQTENNMETSKLMTPKTPKSRPNVLSPKSKSPKRERTKSDTVRKGRKATVEKEEKVAEPPQIKKKVISLAQLARNGSDSSDDDNDSAVESVGMQSARGEGRSVTNKMAAANVASPTPSKSSRLSLAAMVHDTDSENEESGSDDEHSTAASIGPRIVQQQAISKSPRRGPGWWNTPGGTKRRSFPHKGTRPISPPLEKSKESQADSD